MADRRVAENREPPRVYLRDKTCGPQVAIAPRSSMQGTRPMVQLTLPRNSRIKTGKTWNRPQGKGKWKEFRVYRWNPEDGRNPRIDGYWIAENTRCRSIGELEITLRISAVAACC